MKDEDLLTVQEAAARFSISETTVRSAVRRNLLTYHRRHGRNLLLVGDLQAWREKTKMGRPSKKDTAA